MFLKNITCFLSLLFLFSTVIPTYANNFTYGHTKNGFNYVKHTHSEASYQHAWCRLNNGIEEYANKDKTRVDCLTKTHAVELDFANKWAESVGQALYYQLQTNKRAKVVIILEDKENQMVYFERVKKLSEIYDFDVEYITPKILNIKNGKCPYLDCKCNSSAPSFQQ